MKIYVYRKILFTKNLKLCIGNQLINILRVNIECRKNLSFNTYEKFIWKFYFCIKVEELR